MRHKAKSSPGLGTVAFFIPLEFAGLNSKSCVFKNGYSASKPYYIGPSVVVE